jgi:MOSC domain-containing protein YiiM
MPHRRTRGGLRRRRGIVMRMRTVDELERLWRESSASSPGRGVVRLICVRQSDGVHLCPPSVKVTASSGVEGDRWSAGADPDPEAQVTLMAARVAELVAADHAPLHTPGDNFLVDIDLSEQALPAGSRIRLGSAVLEISAVPHTGCAKFRERFGVDALRWVNHKDHRARRLRGLNCRVVTDGEIAVGDEIELLSSP